MGNLEANLKIFDEAGFEITPEVKRSLEWDEAIKWVCGRRGHVEGKIIGNSIYPRRRIHAICEDCGDIYTRGYNIEEHELADRVMNTPAGYKVA